MKKMSLRNHFRRITLLILLVLGTAVPLKAQNPVNKTKKIVYRKFTSLDFSAQTVQGIVRAPEIFYIFQRKKSQGHNVVVAPKTLNFHAKPSLANLRQELKP